jgi:trimeric autotransporter adhesin
MGNSNTRHTMKISYCSLIVCLFAGLLTHAQVAFNTTGASPDNSAMLDVTSSAKGLLVPRMTTAERIAITLPVTGLLVYDNSLSLFYFYNGTAWAPIATLTNGWSVNGNSGTVSGNNFLGTTDNQALDIKTGNILHTRIRTNGQIEVLNTGRSVFLGQEAGYLDDGNNRYNVGIGTRVMQQGGTAATATTGITSIGNNSSQSTTNTASYNTVAGNFAMGSFTNGGNFNTALGETALLSHTDGSYNTALGAQALLYNTTGNYNVGIGYNSLNQNTSGSENTVIGRSAVAGNTTGNYNIGIGTSALNNNTTASNNMFIGSYANTTVLNLSNAAAIGYSASVSQNNSLVLGRAFGATVVNTGIGTTTPLSTFDITGTAGMTIKSGQVAGTDNPDNTASVWLYTSGTGTITLPAATDWANRIYIIVNQTGATINISSYNNLAGTAQTTQATGSMMIVSNGTDWLQVR